MLLYKYFLKCGHKNQALLQSDDKLSYMDHLYRSENEEIPLIIFLGKIGKKPSLSSRLGIPIINWAEHSEVVKRTTIILWVHLGFFISLVPVKDPIREMAEYMDPARDKVWEKGPSNKQVTFLVYREGDRLNFFRVVDRGDGTLTPLSESLR